MCVSVGTADPNTIPDARIKASSLYNAQEQPFYGRLNGSRGNGAWCPKTSSDKTEYLQVDMGAVYYVCAVATQGSRTGNHWTTSFKLHFSIDGATWKTYKENNAEKVST